LQTSTLKLDLTRDPTIYNLTKDDFDYGLRLDYSIKNLDPGIFEKLDQYIDLRIT